MFAAACSLLGRSLFVTVAAPLVLLGSLLVQVSIELEVQSVQNLKYAVEESSIAIGSEEEAARDVGEAALDQTEAELLDNEAKSLDANVAESTAASAAEAAEGEAAVEAAEGEKVSELSEQVESLASVVAEKLPKLPVAAEAGGLDVAGEAAVDAVAATASGVAAPAVGADAVLAGVAGTVAEEGPKVVAAAKEEWAVGSTELQAANDERLGVEKEVQAGALEADVPILQASAASAEEAAYGSMLTAVGYLTGATASQLLALVVQVPVLAVFGSQWMLELRATVKSKVEGIRTQDSTQLTVEFLSYLALYGAVGASMLTPWANLVVMAARFEEMGDEVAHQLSAIPALVSKALPILTHRDTSTTEFRHQNASLRELKLRRAHPRRLWDWKKPMGWMTKTVDSAEKEVQTIAEEGNEVVGDIEKDGIKAVKALPNLTKKAVKALPNLTKKAVKALPNITKKAGKLLREGEKSADKEVKEATDAAREGAIEVVKGLAFKPNTLTTTVAPLHLSAAPAPLSFGHFVSVATNKVWQSLLYWLQPVVTDLFIISLTFAAFELAMSSGRLCTRRRNGHYKGCLDAFLSLCMDIWSSWVFGFAILLAIWIFGILFSKELQFVALWVQAIPAHLAVPILGSFCAAFGVYYVIRSLGYLAEDVPQRDGIDVLVAKDYEQLEVDALIPARNGYTKVRSLEAFEAFEEEEMDSGGPWWLVRSLAFAILTVLVTVLAAVEGPIISAAVGSSYKAMMMSCWSWGVLPWAQLLPQVGGHPLTLTGLFALVTAGGCLIGCLLSCLRHSARKAQR